jgi:hypothetical protein
MLIEGVAGVTLVVARLFEEPALFLIRCREVQLTRAIWALATCNLQAVLLLAELCFPFAFDCLGFRTRGVPVQGIAKLASQTHLVGIDNGCLGADCVWPDVRAPAVHRCTDCFALHLRPGICQSVAFFRAFVVVGKQIITPAAFDLTEEVLR